MDIRKLAAIAILALTILGAGVYTVTVSMNKQEPVVIQEQQDKEQKEVKYIPENEVENMKLKDINGNEVSMAEFKGKRVYVNFWATWCEPCKDELQDIEKLYQETKDTDLVIVTVVMDGTEESIKDYLSKNKYDFKVLLDSDGRISDYNNIEEIPSSYFINTNGEVVSKRVGQMTLEQMKSEIEKLKTKVLVTNIGGNNNEKIN